jgi:hypothetical protein
MGFNLNYLLVTVSLFIIELLIALYVRDTVIRPFGGDFLVVILLYCFVKTFVNTPVIPTALAVLFFAYLVEASQYFHLINVIGLENSKVARIIMGTFFSWTDMLMYTLGIILVMIVERQANTLKLKAKA